MRCLVVSLKLPPFKKFFLGVAFPYCTSFDHETKLAVLIAQAKAKSGSDLKFPRDLLTTSSACMQHNTVRWLVGCMRETRARQCELSRDTCLVLHDLHSYHIVYVFLLFCIPRIRQISPWERFYLQLWRRDSKQCCRSVFGPFRVANSRTLCRQVCCTMSACLEGKTTLL